MALEAPDPVCTSRENRDLLESELAAAYMAEAVWAEAAWVDS